MVDNDPEFEAEMAALWRKPHKWVNRVSYFARGVDLAGFCKDCKYFFLTRKEMGKKRTRLLHDKAGCPAGKES